MGTGAIFGGDVVLPQCTLRVAAATASAIGLSSGGLPKKFRYGVYNVFSYQIHEHYRFFTLAIADSTKLNADSSL